MYSIKKIKIYILLMIAFVFVLMVCSIQLIKIEKYKIHKTKSESKRIVPKRIESKRIVSKWIESKKITNQSIDTNITFNQTDILNDEPRRIAYDIDTPGCKIRSYEPFGRDVTSNFKRVHLDCPGKPRLFRSNLTHLILVKDNLKYYNTQFEHLLCFYSELKRLNANRTAKPDFFTWFSMKMRLKQTMKMNVEFVKIECRNNSLHLIYKDYFSFVLTRKRQTKFNSDRYNVIILGIDNLSRLGFRRSMSKTYDYMMQHLDVIEFLGYSKVGENTFPNLIPLTTGMSVKELSKKCWKRRGFFDDCPFIWKDFNQSRYATAYGEDNALYGLFVYLKKGFNQQPVDHYWNPFIVAANADIASGKAGESIVCLGSTTEHSHLINYTIDFANVYDRIDRNFFGFFWINGVSHDSFNLPQAADNDIKRILIEWTRLKHYNNTIFIIVSDHGYRWSNYRFTEQGQHESNLPAFFLFLPKNFKFKYKQAYKNLKDNAQKLTSPYDLYETLKDVANQEYEREENAPPGLFRGVSLFRNISKNRSCADIGMDVVFCPCEARVIPVNEKLVLLMVKKVISYMNSKIVGRFCYELSLDTILEAQGKIFGWIVNYRIIFRTLPNMGEYEATLQCTDCLFIRDITISGPVLRLNFHRNQSFCVEEEELKLYCMCRIFK